MSDTHDVLMRELLLALLRRLNWELSLRPDATEIRGEERELRARHQRLLEGGEK